MSLLAYPLSQGLLLLLFALVMILLDRRRSGICALLIGTTWLYISSTAVFADYLMASLEDEFRPKALSVLPSAQAIVLLGGAVRGDTHLSSMGDLNAHADRLVHAVSLYKAGKAPLILVSGGGAPGDRTEAEIMKQTLEVMGVPARVIMRENQSRDTHDNAIYSAILLSGKGINKILLVTSAFHMARAVPLFEAQGLQVIPAPTDYQRLVGGRGLPRWLPSVSSLYRTTTALHEYVGFWVYRYRGWL